MVKKIREDEKIARQARVACEKWMDNFKKNIDKYHMMHNFVLGNQWTDEEQGDMKKTYKKIPLTANKLDSMANSLLGEQQQNTPQLQVVPMSNCDEKVASVRELIVKDIMFSTNATISYQMSASQAFIGGFGAFGIGTDYVHDKSFDQDIVYYYFKDATRVYWDLGAEKVNKTDGEFCGYLSRISRKKLRKLYGKNIEKNILSSSIKQTEEEIELAVSPDQSNNSFNWADDESVTIINHFLRKYEKDTLFKLSNGNVLNEEEMKELVKYSREMNEKIRQQKEQEDLMMMTQSMGNQYNNNQKNSGLEDYGINPYEELGVDLQENNMDSFDNEIMTLWNDGEVIRIEDSRPYKKSKIIYYKIVGDYILDESEFPSQQLPIVFVDNRSYYDKDGSQVTCSFFEKCVDTQKYINYLRTQSAYILKVSRYDQWIGPKTVVSGRDTRQIWTDPTNVQGLLAYDKDEDGLKPEQIRPPELSASLFQQYQLAIEDLYTCSGLYPARLGDMGNSGGEASGKAIDGWQRQGSYATYVSRNSINRAIATGGEIVNEMIPYVYDTERVMTLMMPDKGIQNIKINEQTDDYGEKIKNDIRKGTYQVRLKPGPSYEGQKEQALQSLREVIQVDPATFNLVADLYAENLPLANTIEIKNRLKTLVSPQIIEAGKTGEMPQQQGPSPEEQQIQIQQQEAQADVQYKQAQIQIKQQELVIKEKQMQADIEIEKMKLEIARIELSGDVEEQRLRYLAETDRTSSDNAISHADNLVKIMTHRKG